MAIDDKLSTSKAAALRAKDAFMAEFAADRDDRAIGLGLNRGRNGWAVKVYAKSEAATSGLPRRFQGYDVDVELAGEAVAR